MNTITISFIQRVAGLCILNIGIWMVTLNHCLWNPLMALGYVGPYHTTPEFVGNKGLIARWTRITTGTTHKSKYVSYSLARTRDSER